MSNMLNITNRKTTTVQLPSYEGSEVVLYTSLLIGEVEEVQNAGNDLASGIATLQKLIKSWNFVKEDGTALEITLENIKLLPANDVNVLMTAIAESQKEADTKKEKSSSV